MQEIFRIIEQYNMIEPDMHVIVGVSGGADSVCLLYVLTRYRERIPLKLTAVHVEHGLRGEESLADAAFTEALCRQLDVSCRIVTAQVKRLAEEKGLSVEEAGRAERYRIFETVRQECGAQRIAVAHSRNDQAETVLWNLVRGSGLKGLGGIRPVRGSIIRPLLFTDRGKIERLLRAAGITWRTDATNLEQDYTRNRIRLSLLPQMERELNSNATVHIAEAAQRLQKVQDYVSRMADRAVKRSVYVESGVVCVELSSFLEEDALIRQEILRHALQLYGASSGNGHYAMKDFGETHFRMLDGLAHMDCGKECHLPGRLRAVRENGRLCLTENTGAGKSGTALSDSAERFAGNGVTEKKSGGEFLLTPPGIFYPAGWCVRMEILENRPEFQPFIKEEKKYTKWLSYDTIGDSVRLRTRRPGDYLVINSEGKRKKLKDYMIDVKIPKERRDSVPLLADGSHVLWIPGYRISEAVRVTEETNRILRIQLEEVQDEGKGKDFSAGT